MACSLSFLWWRRDSFGLRPRNAGMQSGDLFICAGVSQANPASMPEPDAMEGSRGFYFISFHPDLLEDEATRFKSRGVFVSGYHRPE